MWEIQHNDADWDCFRTLILPEIWKTQNQHQVEFCAFSEVTRSCPEVGCARNRLQFHTVQRNLKIISLDAGLRTDGIPVLDLWDLSIEVFHSTPNQFNNTKDQVRGNSSRNTASNKHSQNQTKFPTQHDDFDVSNVDHFPSNAKSSRFGGMLYIFEDEEAVIKMNIKGRSPTMRHVSRTHRVALDWLFDRINLDPKIQIKYGRQQTPTRRHIDKRELHTSAISAFSVRSEFQLDQLHGNDGEKDARTERRQQDRGKVKADDDEPGLHCLDKVSGCAESGCVEKPGDTQSTMSN